MPSDDCFELSQSEGMIYYWLTNNDFKHDLSKSVYITNSINCSCGTSDVVCVLSEQLIHGVDLIMICCKM